MYESRKVIRVLVPVLLFGLLVGVAHADNDSTEVTNLDSLDHPVTETLVADLANDSIVTADAEPAVSPDCASDTAVTAALGIEDVLSASVTSSGWAWTCGPCSISACANLPVGNPCGFNRWCVVTTSCSTVPLTERCVCGTDHF